MKMGFKKATDILFFKVGPEDLASVLDGSPQSIRQARMEPGTVGHRAPPPGWEAAVAEMARYRAEELQKLAAKLGLGQARIRMGL